MLGGAAGRPIKLTISATTSKNPNAGYDNICKANLLLERNLCSIIKCDTIIQNDVGTMIIEFNGEIWYWRGPSPYYFITVPAEQGLDLKTISGLVTYGWGMIPAVVRIGQTEWKTSLFPKNGGYIVPIKDRVRNKENLGAGDVVTVRLEVRSKIRS